MGSTFSPFEQQSHRVDMVVDLCGRQEWFTNSTDRQSNTSDYDPRRCIRYSLGSKFTRNRNHRLLDRRRKDTIYQRSGVISHFVRTSTARGKIQKQNNKNLYRQYYRCEIRSQVRRYLIHNTTTTGSGNARLMQLLQSEGRISTYSRSGEYSGRQAKSNSDQESSVRSSNTEKDLQHNQSSMGTIENRRLCIADKSPTSSILESAPRPGSDSPRCLQLTVGKGRNVSVSTLETHSTSNPANQATEDPIRSSSDATVDDTTLVSDDIAIETVSTTDDVQTSTMENGRMEVIKKKCKNDGLRDDEIEFLNHAIRKNTNRIYNMGWRK